MKKLLSLLAVAALLFCVTGAPALAANANIIINGQTIVNGAEPTPVPPGAIIYDTNGNAVAAQGAPVYNGAVQVTKSPTSETVEKGGKATFVAHAAGSTGITWRLVSADGLETIYAAAAPQYFTGVEVWGIGTDSLTIKNIPDSMNGWLVEAMFDGQGGPVFSYGARITVVGSSANGTTTDKNPNGRIVTATNGVGGAPVINTQPKGAQLTSGKSTTLSVTAGTNDGGTLHYQWYVSTSEDNTAGQAIAGATSASYTPGELLGTRYYYVGVWSEKDGVKSDTVFSEPAAVIYSGPAVAPAPSETPASGSASSGGGTTTGGTTTAGTGTSTAKPAATTTNSGSSTGGTNTTAGTGTNSNPAPASAQPVVEGPTETAEPTPAPTASVGTTVVEPTRSTEQGNSSMPVILGAIAAVALASGVGLLVLRRNSGS